MTETLTVDSVTLTLDKAGAGEYTKISYPLRAGVYSEIDLPDMTLHFNLNNEILRAKGKDRSWIHPQEWLKRTRGNDWVYYSTGGYTGVFEATGEYYLPNLQYTTNSLVGGKPFAEPAVAGILETWHPRVEELRDRYADRLPRRFGDFLSQAAANTPALLQERAEALFGICGGRVSVMPPDARHVDYDIIPLTLSTGCLYKCRFCRIKSEHPFRALSREEIDVQIRSLRELYARDIRNYNSVILGEHDALNAPGDLILDTANRAIREFGLSEANIRGANLFLFGSVDSLAGKDLDLFAELNRLPARTYINLGLESADQETLDRLGKPITARQVREAFDRIQEINRAFDRIEVTANFIMDDNLPGGHYPAFLDLVRERLPHTLPKGCVYLSPLRIGKPSREVMFDFNRLKVLSRVPTFLYIIQRL